MIRPVAFSRSYWLRRRRELANRLLRLYLQTGMPHIIQSGVRLRWICLTQTSLQDAQLVQGMRT